MRIELISPHNINEEKQSMRFLPSNNRFLTFLLLSLGILISLLPGEAQSVTTSGDEGYEINSSSTIAFENFPYNSNFLELSNGLKMHYLDEGSGETILLLHGNPTSSFLWRNIIPSLASRGRVIAPDLINFGLSDQTDPLNFIEHGQFVSELIESLNLKNIIFIGHDWGGPIGLTYAARNPEQVKALAFFESPVVPLPNIQVLPSDFVEAFIDPANSRTNIVDNNLFVEGFLFDPAFGGIANMPTESEKTVYRQPFLTPSAREQIFIFPPQIPFINTTGHPIYDPDGPGGNPPQPVPNIGEFINFANYLATTEVPRLVIAGIPGFIDPNLVLALAQTIPGLEAQTVGSATDPAFHFLPEDVPLQLSEVLADWLDTEVITSVPESSPVLGLLILGSLGTGSMILRTLCNTQNFHQKKMTSDRT